MQLSTRKFVLLLGAMALMGVLGTYAVLSVITVQFPNTLRFKVKEPLFDLRGPTIVFDQAFETSLGSTTTFAILVENGDGPINAAVHYTANVTGWTEDPAQVSFAYRLQVNGVYISPINSCPHADTSRCTMPFQYPLGITVFRGTVEIGPLAAIAPFELQFFLTKG